MDAGAWREANAHVAAPWVLGLEGKTPKEALLTEVLNLSLESSYQR